jgi:hypothetical protein
LDGRQQSAGRRVLERLFSWIDTIRFRLLGDESLFITERSFAEEAADICANL